MCYNKPITKRCDLEGGDFQAMQFSWVDFGRT